jgi:uncharacterized protein YndB with AHSA1/START domain
MSETPSAQDTDRGEVTITREFDAPRELVFRAMIEPEQLTCFWGPVGVSTPVENIKIDPRPGGTFETIMVDDASGAEYASKGIYIDVVEPELLSWHEPDADMTTTSTFEDLGNGRTRVVIHQTNVPAMYRTPEAQAGFNSSLDRLAAHLAHGRH